MQIYITRDGQRLGPYPAEEVSRQVAAGTISTSDLAWYEGAANWMPLSSVPGLTFTAPAAGGIVPPTIAPAPAGVPATTVSSGYGGFWLRVVAYIIDAVILGIVGGIVNLIVTSALGGGDTDRSTFVALVGVGVNVVLAVIYFGYFWSSDAQASLGQRVCGLRVITTDGGRLSLGRAVGRYFALVLAFAILLIGVIMVAFTERKQGLHDMIVGTYVVKA